MPDFDFVGPSYSARSVVQDCQECINWFPEIDSEKQDAAYVEVLGRQEVRGVIALYPTPGMIGLVTLPAAAEVRALYTLPSGTQFLAVCGNALYLVATNFSYQQVGALASSSGIVSVTDNGIAAYLVDGQNRYSYTFATQAFAVLPPTDGAFQGGDVCTEVDNYIVYNRPDSSQFAATDALSTTTQALSFAAKLGSSDNLVALIAMNRNLHLLGTRTYEAWIDVGSFPFPFQIIPGTAAQYGCAAKWSVCLLENTFCYLGQDTHGQGKVFMVGGEQHVRISNHAVENDLVGQVLSDARAFTYQIGGHEFYVLTFPTADRTWVFDLRTQMWHKWLSVDAFGAYHRHRANCSCFFQGQVIVGDFANGTLYALDQNTFTDNGQPIRRLRRAPHVVSNLQRQFFRSLQIQFEAGAGLITGQGQTPQAMLRWSNDGGKTWSAEKWVSIGQQGQYKARAIWRRLGQARDRVFEVVVTDPINAVIVSAELQSDGGAH